MFVNRWVLVDRDAVTCAYQVEMARGRITRSFRCEKLLGGGAGRLILLSCDVLCRDDSVQIAREDLLGPSDSLNVLSEVFPRGFG